MNAIAMIAGASASEAIQFYLRENAEKLQALLTACEKLDRCAQSLQEGMKTLESIHTRVASPPEHESFEDLTKRVVAQLELERARVHRSISSIRDAAGYLKRVEGSCCLGPLSSNSSQ